MEKRKRIIFITISILTLIFPIGYLFGKISRKIAFPLMFTLMGCQQLYRGFFITPKDKKAERIFGFTFGVGLVIFGVYIAMTFYR